jgi:hypothetical protein
MKILSDFSLAALILVLFALVVLCINTWPRRKG